MARNNPYALKFNGSNSWVRIPTKPELRIPNNFTLSACIYKLDNGYLPTGDILCNHHAGGYKIYSSSESVGGELHVGGNYRSISYTLTDNELNENDYFFIHLTYDGSYMRLYLNGELVNIVSQTGNVSHPTNVPLAIGANPGTSGIDSDFKPFNGIIDNVSLWNKALTPEEVKYYMRRKLRGDEEGLVGYWPLHEGEGNIAHDLSPYQNHGTIYNAQWVEGEVDLAFYYSLIKSNNKYYTYQDNEFIEVEPTVENFKENSVDLSQLTTPTDKVVLTMEGEGTVGDGRVYRKIIDNNKYVEIEEVKVI